MSIKARGEAQNIVVGARHKERENKKTCPTSYEEGRGYSCESHIKMLRRRKAEVYRN